MSSPSSEKDGEEEEKEDDSADDDDDDFVGEDVRKIFNRDGFLFLPAQPREDKTVNGSQTEVIDADAFVAQMFREFRAPSIPTESFTSSESSAMMIDLDDSSTWPRETDGKRRIWEVCAPGKGEHWVKLCESARKRKNTKFVRLIDQLLGENAWHVSLNQEHEGRCKVRHWYSPLVFPEGDSGVDEDEVGASRFPRKIFSSKRRRAKFVSLVLEEDGAKCEDVLNAMVEGRRKSNSASSSSSSSSLTPVDEVLLCAHEYGRRLKSSMGRVLHHKKPKYFRRRKGKRRDDNNNPSESNDKLLFGGDHRCSIYQHNATTRTSASSRAFYPVNRRRVLGKGWHIDIGPGFDADAQRRSTGHPMQGLILLVLLSDSHEGGGGTAFVRGSHRSIIRNGFRENVFGEENGTNQDLNNFAQQSIQDQTVSRDLYMSYEKPAASLHSGRGKDIRNIEQIVGKKGGIAILHPWLVHSGTTNHRSSLRVMMNGMIRFSEDAFVYHGLRILDDDDDDDDDVDDENDNDDTAQTTRTDLLLRGGGGGSTVTKAFYSSKTFSRNYHRQSVSIIMPVHNAEKWLDESVSSILTQSYDGPLEVSFFNDASTDGSFQKMREWMLALRYAGIDVKITEKSENTSGRLESKSECKNRPGGIGFAKNRSVEYSQGSILVFFDADDIMANDRVKMQVQHTIESPSSIIGTTWKRFPDGSTAHYEQWANRLSNEEMILEQFRENTVQMPTWAMARKCFDDVPGGFEESPPDSGEAEDTIFFHKHLDIHAEENKRRGKFPILRAASDDGCNREEPLLYYRWTETSGTSRVPRRRLLDLRVSIFEARVLSKPLWNEFQIWGCGRDARNFVTALSANAKKKIVAIVDLDDKKIGKMYNNLPIEHFSAARRGMCTVVCVSKRRKGAISKDVDDELIENVSALGLIEGSTLWYFF